MQAFKPTSFIVGLTGGIGSGKTVCSDHFDALGVPVIDTDIIAREIVEPGQPALQQLVDAFGRSILNQDQTLDRSALRKIAFASAEAKLKLDQITHPAIYDLTISKVSEVTFPYCVLVIPLLNSDSAYLDFLRRVLVVTAARETKIERVKKRSKLSRDEVVRIMETQLSDGDRLKIADDIIENDASLAEAQQQVEVLHKKYLELGLQD